MFARYLWNHNLKGLYRRIPLLLRAVLLLTTVAALVAIAGHAEAFVRDFLQNDQVPLWLLLFGSVGQAIFSLRFVYQWLYSARHGESSLPVGFWAMSLVGSAMIVCYALFRLDPVLILGQSVGFIAYARNLLIGRKHDHEA